MNNIKWKKLKSDPIKYANHKKKKKKYYEALKQNTEKYNKYLENQKRYRIKNGQEVFRGSRSKNKNSEYWKREKGYERYYKYRPFRRMAKGTNVRCKKGKITAFQLWCLAKKQKLICPLTKEKLTIENISVDHIIPISKGGTNEISNLQLITFRANVAKNSMTMDEFYLFCRMIVDNYTPPSGGSTAALK